MKTEEEYSVIMERVISILDEEGLGHFEELMILESVKSLLFQVHLIELGKEKR